ncbi:hypothetical protein KJ616_02505 [Patescibacteria group bacterium]|nr:hypothetical protein [Patescibacteria group bacterium]
MKKFSVKYKLSISLLMIILFVLLLMPFVDKSERDIFFKKGANFYLGLKGQEQKSENFPSNFVWASNPLIVNSLPTCPFSDGDIGEIFVKNSGCSWSDYKCTLTNYDKCNSGVDYYGSPWGDYCWCYYDSSKICATQVSISWAGCWSWKSYVNYSEFCNLCVRR